MIKPLVSMSMAVAVGGVLVVSGCQLEPSTCDAACRPCAPALSLKVTSSSGTAVENVTISNGATGTCSVDGNVTSCALSSFEPGTFEFDLQAPGFQTTHVKQTIAAAAATGCCACGYEAKTVEVTMSPQ